MSKLFELGDVVKCTCPGSWIHNLTGTIIALGVLGPDNLFGHVVQFSDARCVVEEFELTKVKKEST